MISVVVPVYNVEEYLECCIKSILRQTYTDLEIILVDDGSTDSSGLICDELKISDDRIQVFHKKNSGLMSAWKYGVMHSHGEYIGFVDSDDYIDSNMYENLLSCMEKYNCDIALCGLIREYDSRSEKETIYPEKDFYNRDDIINIIFPKLLNSGNMLNRYISPNRVTKLFRRNLLTDNMKYCDDSVSLGEDLLTTFACICDASSVAVCRTFFPYHYKIRSSSIMGKFNATFLEQAKILTGAVRKVAENKNVFDFSGQITDDFISLAYYGIETNIGKKDCKRKEIVDYIKKTLNDPVFKKEADICNLYNNNYKCRIYRILEQLHCYDLFYLFVKYIVLPKRNKK